MQSSNTFTSKDQPQTLKGIVKAVQSGDALTISKTAGKTQFEEQCFMAYITAPRPGTNNRSEEPFAFDAREFVREKVIGRKVDFTIEYQIKERKYITILWPEEKKEEKPVEPEKPTKKNKKNKQQEEEETKEQPVKQSNGMTTLNLLLVQKGLAKAREQSKPSENPTIQEIVAASADCESRKVGLWNDNQKHLEKHTREVAYPGETLYNTARMLEEANTVSGPMAAILEYVMGPTFLSLYVYKLKAQIKLSMTHVYVSNKDFPQELVDQGKAVVNNLLLHKTVGVKLAKINEQDPTSFVGRVHFPAGDIACELLKQGLVKVSAPKSGDDIFDADYFKELKQAQLIGQSKRAGIWKNYEVEEEKQNSFSSNEFVGKIVEVHSGDCVTVEREDFSLQRLFFSSVKAPKCVAHDESQSEPYGWESKEALRKASIGKKVRVETEFQKDIQLKTGGEMSMTFASIFLTKNSKNIAVMQLEKGLAFTNLQKSADNASKYLEDLLAAEKRAQEKKLCLHNKKEAPQIVFADLIGNTKQAKEFEQMINNRTEKTFSGVIEHCFSGMKFKVRLEGGENRIIAFALLGVRPLSNDKNQPAMLKFAEEALSFAKEHLMQRDVQVEVFSCDKRGTFFGTVFITNHKQDFALKLVEEGLAMVSNNGFEKRLPQNMHQIEEAEQKAKKQELGIWNAQLKLVAQGAQGGNQRQVERKFGLMAEVDVEVTHIEDATLFFIRQLNKQAKDIDQRMSSFDAGKAQELEKPIRKGTLCAGLYGADKSWYRCRIVNSLGKNQYEVQFIDFGNRCTIGSESLKKLPQDLLAYEPMAYAAKLAYIRTPQAKKMMGKESIAYLKKYCLNQDQTACICDEIVDGNSSAISPAGRLLKVVLTESGESDWSASVNAYLINEGMALIGETSQSNVDDDQIPDDAKAWQEYQDEARDTNAGVWKGDGQIETVEDQLNEDY